MAVMASVRRTQEFAQGNTGPGMNVVAVAILLGATVTGGAVSAVLRNPIPVIVTVLIGAAGAVAEDRAAVGARHCLALRPLHRPARSRLVLIVPFIDQVSSVIDQRTIATGFAAEQTLTADTVPVNVDAVLFWMVHDAEKAALEVQDYGRAVAWAAQTALRDIIGRTTLADLLARPRTDRRGPPEADRRTIEPWGVTVSSVEMRDIVIPARCRTRCRGRRKPSAKNRRASSSARPSSRSPRRLRRRRSHQNNPPRCICAR
jgi:regulator of protease activity HflC (stomatin/prohibitin superfamily)